MAWRLVRVRAPLRARNTNLPVVIMSKAFLIPTATRVKRESGL